MLTPFSFYYMTFNFGGKKARDVGLTSRFHLSNFMPDNIFYDGMGWETTQFIFCFFLFCFSFLGVVIDVFLSIEEVDLVLSL